MQNGRPNSDLLTKIKLYFNMKSAWTDYVYDFDRLIGPTDLVIVIRLALR